MKRISLGLPWGGLVIMALLAGLPFFWLCSGAEARGGGGFVGGGFMGGGGLSGGSFRGGGGWAEGPRGGGVIVGHQGGLYGRTPGGGEVYRGPYGAGVARGPFGGEAVRGPKVITGPQGGEVVTGARGNVMYGERGPRGAHMVTAPGNWGPYYGPTWSYAPAGAGAAVAVGTVGTILNTLPPGAVPRTVAGTRYYYGAGVYYLPCYQGSELAYCVVPDPNQ
jgi:hypothetical protein